MAITYIYNVELPFSPMSDNFVLIKDKKIMAVGRGSLPIQNDWKVVEGRGNLLMPGVIDCHVHFREPGLTHKADIASETRAAVAGGVTSYIDMPNTVPQTTTIAAWRDKCKLAREKSLANYAFFIGATNSNLEELKGADYTQLPGVKLFMGSSTGNMLVDKKDSIEHLFAELPPEVPIAIHAEDQKIIQENTEEAKAKYPGVEIPLSMHSWIRSTMACQKATRRALELAEKHPRHIHICHVSTSEEVDDINDYNENHEVQATYEVSPHHLLWCKNDYARKGARIKMNPSVKSAEDRQYLRDECLYGEVPMIATDHAPHLLSEKEGDALKAVSGAPILQFSLPLTLTLFGDPDLVSRLMSQGPARVYGIKDRGWIDVGYYADLVLVRKLAEPHVITDEECLGKCGWSPAAGEKVNFIVEKTWVNGQLAYDKGRVVGNPGAAMPLEFEHHLILKNDDGFEDEEVDAFHMDDDFFNECEEEDL